MTDPVAGLSPDCALAATPSNSEISEMIDALDAVDPRPPLTSYEAFLADGIEAAAEVREFERRRAGLMAFLYGDIEEAA